MRDLATLIQAQPGQSAPPGFGWILLGLVGGLLIFIGVANRSARSRVKDRHGDLGPAHETWTRRGFVYPPDQLTSNLTKGGAALVAVGVLGFVVSRL